MSRDAHHAGMTTQLAIRTARAGEAPADVGGTARTLPRLALALRPLPGTNGPPVLRP
ncbi:MAG TPA: hypothetical protein VFX39_06750 [Gemmatimonadaceae bacterium]|nr:hypothetical protein [Gemmatimonadaceae bacterium]